MIARLKGRVYTLVRLGVTLGAVWLVFHNVDWANLARLLAHADIGLLALSVVPLAAQRPSPTEALLPLWVGCWNGGHKTRRSMGQPMASTSII